MNEYFKNFIKLVTEFPNIALLFALGSIFLSLLFAYLINRKDTKRLDEIIDELEIKLENI